MTPPLHAIEVRVQTRFLPEQSKPEDGRFVFAYTIRIHNAGKMAARLVSRHWVITDGNGKVEEVRGEGVVGEQPVLGPGERYEYTSGVPLPTASGFMAGTYQMVTDSGEPFVIKVPDFSLDSPDHKRVLN